MHVFGLGPGWMPEKVREAARRHGAELVNYTDPQCKCGRGCKPHECPKSRRHWFSCEDLGAPHNENTASRVMAAVAAARTQTGGRTC